MTDIPERTEIYEAICAYYEKMLTYQKRESFVMNKCLIAINELFDVIWQHKEVLIDFGIFEPLFENAKILLGVVEERADVSSQKSISAEELTKEITEIMHRYDHVVHGL